MRAVVCHDSKLNVVDLPDPRPDDGQVLLEVTGCGICGSDLHARHPADAQADVLAEAGDHGFARSDQQVVFRPRVHRHDRGPRTGHSQKTPRRHASGGPAASPQ